MVYELYFSYYSFKHGLSNVTSRFFMDILGICWTNQICPKCSFVTGRISRGGEGWSDSGIFSLCSISELLKFGQSRSRHLLGSVVERQPRTNRITLQPEEKDTQNSPWKLGSHSLLGWAPTPLQRWEHSMYLQWVESQRHFTKQQQQSTPASLYCQ